MTATQFNRAVRALSYKHPVILPSGSEIIMFAREYGPEYSLRAKDGQTVICTWNIDEIKSICID